jgi:pyridoxal phosphate enzyme (YggS family)
VSDSTAVAERLARIEERIAAASKRSGRSRGDVRLVAVSKRQPVERIAAAVRAGLRDLGENRVQEARDKREAVLAAIEDAPPPRWHLIGSLQRNKAALATALFDRIETVDRESLAAALARHAQAAGRRLPVLLQVNISREPQKGGALPEGAAELLAACAAHEALEVVGLMAIPAAVRDPEASRPAFAQLRALRDTLSRGPGGRSLTELSMGMSSDFEVAIEEGATSVRVGTALFGERTPREER